MEAAWHYAHEPRNGASLHQRQQGQPAHILQLAWRAQHRLYRLSRRMASRGKPGNVGTIALARELAASSGQRPWRPSLTLPRLLVGEAPGQLCRHARDSYGQPQRGHVRS